MISAWELGGWWCEGCGRSHKKEQLIDECIARAVRKLVRSVKKTRDTERRAATAAAMPAKEHIRARHADGIAWVNIVSGLKKNYPPPAEGDTWSLMRAVELYAETLNWPGVSQETRVWALLEREALGEFITWHPLREPSIQRALEGSMDPGVLSDWFLQQKGPEEVEAA